MTEDAKNTDDISQQTPPPAILENEPVAEQATEPENATGAEENETIPAEAEEEIQESPTIATETEDEDETGTNTPAVPETSTPAVPETNAEDAAVEENQQPIDSNATTQELTPIQAAEDGIPAADTETGDTADDAAAEGNEEHVPDEAEQQKLWKVRANKDKGYDDPIQVPIIKKKELPDDVEIETYARKRRKIGDYGKSGVVTVKLDDKTYPIGIDKRKGLRHVIGYFQDDENQYHGVTSIAWILIPIIIALLIALLIFIQSFFPKALPEQIGGVIPTVPTTEVTTEDQVGQIEIPGYNHCTIGPNTTLNLNNPEANEKYIFKYTISVEGQVIYETPYWVEAGKADPWKPYEYLSQYSGQEINLTIAISTEDKATGAARNGATQTIKAQIK